MGQEAARHGPPANLDGQVDKAGLVDAQVGKLPGALARHDQDLATVVGNRTVQQAVDLGQADQPALVLAVLQ